MCERSSLAGASFFDRFTRFPKIAVPMRIIVAPSSIATSKSFVMPIERCAMFNPR